MVEKGLRRWGRLSIALALGVSCAALAVIVPSGLAGADTVTYTSAQIGSSGNTPQFSQSGNWTLAWSYNCSNRGSAGNFIVHINQPPGDLASDNGPNELGMSGSGTDSYFDTGVFSLSVNSGCDWSITVSGSSTPPVVG